MLHVIYVAVHCSSISCRKSILNVRTCLDCHLFPWPLLLSAIVLYWMVRFWYRKVRLSADSQKHPRNFVNCYCMSNCVVRCYERDLRESLTYWFLTFPFFQIPANFPSPDHFVFILLQV
jgi:hypothetical protein